MGEEKALHTKRLIPNSGFRPAGISLSLIHIFIAQPDWTDPSSIQILGEPRLGFLVSAGNMDSMVNHYSVSKKRRQQDSYTPGGVMGKRPDYAVVVYCNLIRSVYRDAAIIIGGIEASLRRLAHYDYWLSLIHIYSLRQSHHQWFLIL